MNEEEWLARQFEANRTHLTKVAFRMLGSESEADDAVQEAWLRLSRSDAAAIDNLGGWLTTVVGRICLDMLRSRKARREEPIDFDEPAEISDAGAGDPEREAILADSIGPALLVVLDALTPPERVAFVLHDMFGMPFDEISPIIGRTEAASRQLASRARRKVRGSANRAAAGGSGGDTSGNDSTVGGGGDSAVGGERPDRRVVDAFLKAAREGDLQTLLEVLHPECEFRPDDFAQLIGTPKPIKGRESVAEFFNGGAADARRATIAGAAGAAWAPHGKLRAAISFTFEDDRIVDIEVIADKRRLQELGVELLDS